MSMSVNIHLKNAKNLEIKAYVQKSDFNKEDYAVIRLQSDDIDVSVFANIGEVELLIKQLQSVKRKLNAQITKKVLDKTTL